MSTFQSIVIAVLSYVGTANYYHCNCGNEILFFTVIFIILSALHKNYRNSNYLVSSIVYFLFLSLFGLIDIYIDSRLVLFFLILFVFLFLELLLFLKKIRF